MALSWFIKFRTPIIILSIFPVMLLIKEDEELEECNLV